MLKASIISVFGHLFTTDVWLKKYFWLLVPFELEFVQNACWLDPVEVAWDISFLCLSLIFTFIEHTEQKIYSELFSGNWYQWWHVTLGRHLEKTVLTTQFSLNFPVGVGSLYKGPAANMTSESRSRITYFSYPLLSQ